MCSSIETGLTYFSVLVPFSKHPTEWHPTSSTGPFKVLSRGFFRSQEAAIKWAVDHLQGQPYEIREYPLV